MDLFGPLKRSLAEQQYKTLTPVQTLAIEPAIDGRDILACAQTGTGKTAAFALPILDYIGHEDSPGKPNRPTALVIAPTRELAIQISQSFRVYGKYVHFRQALVYGGVHQRKQVDELRRGVDVLVATPGRLMDLMNQNHIQLDDVQIFVLDEADRMLDMGFLPILTKVIAKLPDDRQSMFFSATLPKKTIEFAKKLLFNPVCITVAAKSTDVKTIDQTIQIIEKRHKFSALCKLLTRDTVERTIVFTRTKRGANQVFRKLEQSGVPAAAIHGNKTQNARQKALENFRRNQVQVLVATDVASRGIDIQGISHVVNYDMPHDPEDYVHRIGRTGRAGAHGVAISFCLPNERGELRAIERLMGHRLVVERSSQDSDNPSKINRNKPRKSHPSKMPRRAKGGRARVSKNSTNPPQKQPATT